MEQVKDRQRDIQIEVKRERAGEEDDKWKESEIWNQRERESKEIEWKKDMEWKSEKERQTENEIRIGETNIQMFVSAQFTQRTKNTQYICIL